MKEEGQRKGWKRRKFEKFLPKNPKQTVDPELFL